MKKISFLVLMVPCIAIFGFSSAYSATAKVTAGCGDLINASFNPYGESHRIATKYIHTPSDKEIMVDVSLEVGLTTDTTVWSKKLERAMAEAEAVLFPRLS